MYNVGKVPNMFQNPLLEDRVARWVIFKQKIQILVNFGGDYVDGKC
jgi:hypothetical protein